MKKRLVVLLLVVLLLVSGCGKKEEKVDSNKVYIRVNDEESARKVNYELRRNLSEYRGESAVYVFNASNNKSYRLAREAWLNLNTDITTILKEKYGEDN